MLLNFIGYAEFECFSQTVEKQNGRETWMIYRQIQSSKVVCLQGVGEGVIVAPFKSG